MICSFLFICDNSIYFSFFAIGLVMFIGGIHPAMEVGNLPPCLLGGFVVVTLPISIHNWNIRQKVKATRALYQINKRNHHYSSFAEWNWYIYSTLDSCCKKSKQIKTKNGSRKGTDELKNYLNAKRSRRKCIRI